MKRNINSDQSTKNDLLPLQCPAFLTSKEKSNMQYAIQYTTKCHFLLVQSHINIRFVITRVHKTNVICYQNSTRNQFAEFKNVPRKFINTQVTHNIYLTDKLRDLIFIETPVIFGILQIMVDPFPSSNNIIELYRMTGASLYGVLYPNHRYCLTRWPHSTDLWGVTTGICNINDNNNCNHS